MHNCTHAYTRTIMWMQYARDYVTICACMNAVNYIDLDLTNKLVDFAVVWSIPSLKGLQCITCGSSALWPTVYDQHSPLTMTYAVKYGIICFTSCTFELHKRIASRGTMLNIWESSSRMLIEPGRPAHVHDLPFVLLTGTGKIRPIQHTIDHISFGRTDIHLITSSLCSRCRSVKLAADTNDFWWLTWLIEPVFWKFTPCQILPLKFC